MPSETSLLALYKRLAVLQRRMKARPRWIFQWCYMSFGTFRRVQPHFRTVRKRDGSPPVYFVGLLYFVLVFSNPLKWMNR